MLGLVTTKRGQLENLDDLKPRIDDVPRFLQLDQLCAIGAVRVLVRGRG